MKRRSMLEGSWINTTFDLSFTPHASKYSPFCLSLPLYTTLCSSTCNPVSPLSTFFTSPVITYHVIFTLYPYPNSTTNFFIYLFQLSLNQTNLPTFLPQPSNIIIISGFGFPKVLHFPELLMSQI